MCPSSPAGAAAPTIGDTSDNAAHGAATQDAEVPWTVSINGQMRDVPAGSSVLDVVLLLGLQPPLVAVERNGQIVPRRQHGDVQIAPGDRLEIVTFVGGG